MRHFLVTNLNEAFWPSRAWMLTKKNNLLVSLVMLGCLHIISITILMLWQYWVEQTAGRFTRQPKLYKLLSLSVVKNKSYESISACNCMDNLQSCFLLNMRLMISIADTQHTTGKNCLIHTRIMADQIQCINDIFNCDKTSVIQI